VVGPKPLEIISRWMNSMTGNFVPVWNPYMPKGASPVKAPSSSSTAAAQQQQETRGVPRQVVYLPSCVTRMMGPAGSDTETASVHEKLMSLFDKAGYEVRQRWLLSVALARLRVDCVMVLVPVTISGRYVVLLLHCAYHTAVESWAVPQSAHVCLACSTL
jgi:hypothetical protein